jgi:hypothetical protein
MMRLFSGFGSRVAPLDAALRCKYVSVLSFRAVNTAVISEIQSRIQEPIADIGEPFESTDCIEDANRPTRRFVVAGHSDTIPTFWVLCYAHGGRFRHFHVTVLKTDVEGAEVLKSDQWNPDWKECSQWESPDGNWPPAVPLDRVLTALRTNEVEHDGRWNHW